MRQNDRADARTDRPTDEPTTDHRGDAERLPSHHAGLRAVAGDPHYSAPQVYALMGCPYPGMNPSRARSAPVEAIESASASEDNGADADAESGHQDGSESDGGDDGDGGGPGDDPAPAPEAICQVCAPEVEVAATTRVLLSQQPRRAFYVCDDHQAPAVAVIGSARLRADSSGGDAA